MTKLKWQDVFPEQDIEDLIWPAFDRLDSEQITRDQAERIAIDHINSSSEVCLSNVQALDIFVQMVQDSWDRVREVISPFWESVLTISWYQLGCPRWDVIPDEDEAFEAWKVEFSESEYSTPKKWAEAQPLDSWIFTEIVETAARTGP